jgi:hypothetical protein
MSFEWQELVGYVASALVVTSLAMTSVVRLRAISLAGSSTFTVYGFLIDSAPIVVTNVAIAGLNVWFLSRELGGRHDLGAVVVPTDSPFLVDFLANHAERIRAFQPEYEPDRRRDVAIVLTRDGLPAGVLLGERDGDRLDVTLDYVLRAYRDSRLGRWLYGDGAGVFRSLGVATVTSSGGSATHRSYLARMGFHHDAASDRYVRSV